MNTTIKHAGHIIIVREYKPGFFYVEVRESEQPEPTTGIFVYGGTVEQAILDGIAFVNNGCAINA